MAEYISRERMLKAVEIMDKLDKETKTIYEYDKEGFLLLIKDAPAEDVAPIRHGQWKFGVNKWGDGYAKCSNCGQVDDCEDDTEEKEWYLDFHKYCHNCGAKMDG